MFDSSGSHVPAAPVFSCHHRHIPSQLNVISIHSYTHTSIYLQVAQLTPCRLRTHDKPQGNSRYTGSCLILFRFMKFKRVCSNFQYRLHFIYQISVIKQPAPFQMMYSPKRHVIRFHIPTIVIPILFEIG